MAAQAPLGILVCADPRLEKYPGFWVQDCAAATQNLLLAVHALGLGGVWTGVYPIEERVAGFRALLDLPEPVVPLSFVVIGHPDQKLPYRSRFKADRVHHDLW
jgi:nitroreductase